MDFLVRVHSRGFADKLFFYFRYNPRPSHFRATRVREQRMWFVGVLVGSALIVLTLVDGFETILQPRRVTHRFRFARLFYRSAWSFWRSVAGMISVAKRREAFLSIFGPVSLLGLFASWVIGLIVGFGVLHWSLGTSLHAVEAQRSLRTYLYLSGTTFFTLGYGDVTPVRSVGRILAVIESGLGFAFLAVIVSYLPVLSQAFSRREVTISLLDARAGSPPSAAQVLLRVARSGNLATIDSFLIEWERWAAELLESQLSFPVLSYYRSQHDNQSWLAALTCMLDTCALLIVGVRDHNTYQAELTFAMARHAAVDLALVLKTPPLEMEQDRLPAERFQQMRAALNQAKLATHDNADIAGKLAELRDMYEPFLNGLSHRLLLTLPPLMADPGAADNWQRSAWTKRTPGIGSFPPPSETAENQHFS
jgi:hypothetical protein